MLAIGEVIDKPADRETVTGGLRADMLSSAVAGVFKGFPLSAFAQNVGLVAITGIRSRFVVAAGGVILVWGHGDEQREGPVLAEAPPVSHIPERDPGPG